jgi:hypothetical protein
MLYAGPHTTKYILEDVFNEVKDKVIRQNKGCHRMNRYSQWFYASACAFIRYAKLPMVTVDFQTYLSKYGTAWKSKATQTKFRPISTELPACVKKFTVKEVQRTWKPAGYRSNRVATAATMYILAFVSDDLKEADFAWAGAQS